jgi:murein DD-endopeptidase MepM/ murein hydrolase activator NlpD
MALARGIYTFRNVEYPTKMLNLYYNGSVANGQNVVLWEQDGSLEQQWKYEGGRLLTMRNQNFALDRYAASGTNQNNADIWEIDSEYSADQLVQTLTQGDGTVVLKLLSDGRVLTATGGSNGDNVWWAAATTPYGNSQKWIYTRIDDEEEETPSGEYVWPTESRSVSQYFSSTHDGIDIRAKTPGVEGDDIYAYTDGYVAQITEPSTHVNEGYSVRIHHINPINNGHTHIRTQYMHLCERPNLTLYQHVSAGDVIGKMGNTGNSTGVHLHFEVRGGNETNFPLGGPSNNGYATGTVLDPTPYLDLTE